FHRGSERVHAGEIGEIELSDLDVARHFGGRLLGLLDASAGDHHAVAALGQRGGSGLADAAVAAGDDDPHQRGAYRIRRRPIRLTVRASGGIFEIARVASDKGGPIAECTGAVARYAGKITYVLLERRARGSRG